jgi:hypothetical protein
MAKKSNGKKMAGSMRMSSYHFFATLSFCHIQATCEKGSDDNPSVALLFPLRLCAFARVLFFGEIMVDLYGSFQLVMG